MGFVRAKRARWLARLGRGPMAVLNYFLFISTSQKRLVAVFLFVICRPIRKCCF